ncbi:hypothetical protein KC332_g8583 [Hortaea werneckii]|uniref:Uncharacterized protein n=1 Tax=Hortaea werneckii EXF-2000 TaxID=1157616 RepID=A0A1Z5TUD9_HORWE|nr:hypothetical protein KC358_g8383 [Hortaea werneckii]OTA39647.1 hypothetical protein BTJ68_00271 [Hortaea werneckii EXF-2000]KAI6925883.1 hypothetical protein KC348_g8841 [Hortaea werneckii]KAI7032869.1 hypothetical protein KC366_g9151 [Hortaea werneckii]KAI7033114.1 hypothetical protein KC362_g8753 [Hortaea werneckii]
MSGKDLHQQRQDGTDAMSAPTQEGMESVGMGGNAATPGGASATPKQEEDGSSSGNQRVSSQQLQTLPQQPPSTIASQTTSAPSLRKEPSSNLAQATTSSSANTSPHSSRNTSPVRRDSRPQTLTQPIATQPSAAAIQRALSAANVPQLQASGGNAAPGGPVTDAVSRLPRASKSVGGAGSGDATPQWPVSPRLKSPPPSAPNSRRGSGTTQQSQQLKKQESAGTGAPSISVQSATPQQAATPPPKQASSNGSDEQGKQEQSLQAPPKVPSRGPSGKSTLETVQENSSDSVSESPAATQAAADLKPLSRISEEDGSAAKREGQDGDKLTQPAESGSESAGSKADQKRGRRQSLTQPKQNATRSSTSKSSYPPLHSAKSRQNEGKANMTVETETVQSIPQSALSAGYDRVGSGRNDPGSLRMKASTETIRPKKERKKPSQKARSLNQGTDSAYDSTVGSPSLVSNDETIVDGGSSSVCCGPGSPASIQRRKLWAASMRGYFSFGYPRKYTYSNNRLRKASSKADIFEARVARDVEEANYTSDSDETFVYESNPPEPQRRPRHHSRTPSVTSSHSIAEQRSGTGPRGYGSVAGGGGGDLDDGRRVAGKRSMKFASNPYNADSIDSPDSAKNGHGSGTSRSGHHQARHIGRFGARGGLYHHQNASGMFDGNQYGESPFTQASKLRNSHLGMRHSSRPNSPRSPQSGLSQPPQMRGPSSLFGGASRKQENSYDFDGEGADDERTPLVGTVRHTSRGSALRGPHGRIQSGSVRSIDEFYSPSDARRRRRLCCGGFGGCVLGFAVVIAVLLSAVGFLIMSNRPMYDVRIRRIENVLASEQEIMLDLMVGAVNPNALGITVGDMDVNVFAKSKHVGSSRDQLKDQESQLDRRRRRGRTESLPVANPEHSNPWQDVTGNWHSPWRHDGDVDDGTDPLPPSDGDENFGKDAQTMLLGRIFHFDQALAFSGSPVKRHTHYSLGEVRLLHPGNKTEEAGSRRWESVVQHPFELIVRGVLRYQLPVSMRTESVSVAASVVVHPEEGIDKAGNMRLSPVPKERGWEWIDWPDVTEDEDPDESHRLESGKRIVGVTEEG